MRRRGSEGQGREQEQEPCLHPSLQHRHSPREPPHLVADGRVPVHHPLDVGIQAGPGGALGQSRCVRLLLALPDDGLTAQPLRHGVLVAGADLVICLQRLEREGPWCPE